MIEMYDSIKEHKTPFQEDEFSFITAYVSPGKALQLASEALETLPAISGTSAFPRTILTYSILKIC